MPYSHLKRVHVGHIPKHKLAKAHKTGKLSLTAHELAGTTHTLHVHPEVHEKLMKAKHARKGARFHHTHHEMLGDLHFMQGGSIWSSIRHFFTKNWDVIKPVVSRVADIAVPAAATYFGHPEFAAPVRAGVKKITGVGMSKHHERHGHRPAKGSAEAKARMAKVRAAKHKGSHGGSFLPAGGY